MKEIRFRVWDKITNQMSLEIVFINFKTKTIGFYALNSHGERKIFERNTDDFPLMEWTGYNDKNGVGIYVEDFVNCNRYENQEDFVVQIKDIRQLPKEMFGSNLNWLEVIGNSFENGGRLK